MKNNKNDIQKINQVKYVLSAFIILVIGAVDYIPNYGINVYPKGHFFGTFFIGILAYAIVKHKLMDIHIVFRKGLIYSFLVTTITVIYLISVLIFERLFHNIFGYKNITSSVFTATIIALIFIPLKNLIQNFVEKTLFRGSYMQITKENTLLRQEIIRTERIKTVATLASGLAHEIKNPLTPIKTFSEELPKRLEDKEFLLKFSRIINQEVNRIDSLVQELLDYAKPSPPQLRPINLHEVLDHTLNFLNNDFIKHKITLIKNYALPAGQLLNLDHKQFQQALLNIFLNAIEAMPNGGQLMIATLEDDNKIILTIADTGKGIAPEDIPHIFDPFFSKKDHGTGLGLAITHEIIRNHNGRIIVDSTVGQGTKFSIEFPV